MIINVSGCDGSGKTTLINNLISKFTSKVTTVHFSNPKDYNDAKNQYYTFLEQHPQNSELILCDRFHEGEWVYAPIYRNYIGDYLEDFEERIITKHNYLLVFLYADLKDIIYRTGIRGEDFVKKEHFQQVLDNFFNNFLMNQILPFISINTSKYNENECFSLTTDAIKKCFTILSAFRKYINTREDDSIIPLMFYPRGNILADYMIVGLNPSHYSLNMSRNSTVFHHGYYCNMFKQTLINAGIYLNSWFTNCFMYPIKGNKVKKSHTNMHQHLLDIQIQLIKPKYIFALGNKSYDYLISTYPNQNVIKEEHPTYVYRFNLKNKEYLDNYIKSFKLN